MNRRPLVPLVLAATALPAVAHAQPEATASLPAASAGCAGPVVDDFTSGAYRSPVVRAGSSSAVQHGAMFGGRRAVTVSVGEAVNPYDQPSSVDVFTDGKRHALVATAGYRAPVRADVYWGGAGSAGRDLRCYDRFRVAFEGLVAPLNVNMQAIAGNNTVVAQSQAGTNESAHAAPFTLEFPFKTFVPNAGPAPDWADIREVRLITQSASTLAGHSFAVTGVTAATG